MKLNFLKSKREKTIFWSITALGISSIVTQLVLMREFLNIFYGNEVVFGIILGNWLLLTGLGAYFGKYIEKIKRKFNLLIFSQIAIALLPFFTIFIIRILRDIIFLPGELINVFHILLYSFILLLPYCLISGYLLTLACIVFSRKKDEEAIGKVYFIDSIGDILGGLLFSFVLIYFLNPFQMALFIMILNLFAAILISRFIRKPNLTIFILALLTASTIFFFIFDLDRISTEIMFKEQNIIYQKNSLYGNLVVTESYGQLNFFENSVPLFSTNNTIANEEVVHYAMVQHENPGNVLLISGGVSGTALEILKYNVSKIDYVEIDPLITEIGRDFTKNLDDSRIKVFNMDGRLFVKTTNSRYDVIIIDLPDPGTAQINRFYTEEFFDELKNILNTEGVVSLSISSSENYMSDEVKKLNSAVYKTLKEKFSNIIIIPGDENFFIASDEGLYYNISERIENKNITTAYVNKYYLSGKLTPERINYVIGSVKEDIWGVPTNKDLSPAAYYYHLLYFFSYFKINYKLFLIIFSIILIIILILSAARFKRSNLIPFAIFTTGFAAASLEVVLLIGFQILYGYVYHMIGFIVTAFMLGLAAGAFYMNINLKKRKIFDIIKIEFIIFIYSIMLPALLILLNKLQSEFLILISAVLFPAMALLIGILTGMEFPLASKLHFRDVAKTAGTLYFSDLFGACIGAFAVGALLIPLLGLINVCIIIGIMNLITGILIFIFRKNWI